MSIDAVIKRLKNEPLVARRAKLFFESAVSQSKLNQFLDIYDAGLGDCGEVLAALYVTGNISLDNYLVVALCYYERKLGDIASAKKKVNDLLSAEPISEKFRKEYR